MNWVLGSKESNSINKIKIDIIYYTRRDHSCKAKQCASILFKHTQDTSIHDAGLQQRYNIPFTCAWWCTEATFKTNQTQLNKWPNDFSRDLETETISENLGMPRSLQFNPLITLNYYQRKLLSSLRLVCIWCLCLNVNDKPWCRFFEMHGGGHKRIIWNHLLHCIIANRRPSDFAKICINEQVFFDATLHTCLQERSRPGKLGMDRSPNLGKNS